MFSRMFLVLRTDALRSTSNPDFVSIRINDRSFVQKKKGEGLRVSFGEMEKEAFS